MGISSFKDFVKSLKVFKNHPEIESLVDKDEGRILSTSSAAILDGSQESVALFELLEEIELSMSFYLLHSDGLIIKSAQAGLKKEGFHILVNDEGDSDYILQCKEFSMLLYK